MLRVLAPAFTQAGRPVGGTNVTVALMKFGLLKVSAEPELATTLPFGCTARAETVWLLFVNAGTPVASTNAPVLIEHRISSAASLISMSAEPPDVKVCVQFGRPPVP